MFCSCDFCSWPVLTETIKCDMINGVTSCFKVKKEQYSQQLMKSRLSTDQIVLAKRNYARYHIRTFSIISRATWGLVYNVVRLNVRSWHTSNVHPESEVHVSRGVKCLSRKISYQVRTSPCEKSQIALSPVSFANDIKHGLWLLWNACRYVWQEKSGRFPQDLLTNVFKCDVMENPFWKKGKVDTKDFCGTLPSTSTLDEPLVTFFLTVQFGCKNRWMWAACCRQMAPIRWLWRVCYEGTGEEVGGSTPSNALSD